MTFPASDVSTTNLDSSTDGPANARSDFLELFTKFNQLRNHFSTLGKDLISAVTAADMRSVIGAQVAGSYAAQGNNADITALTGLVGAGLLPVGAVIFHAANTAPAGYLKANGASVSTTTYANLFAAIGYTYGGSGGSFNLPDLRGEFLRGWDDGRGADSGRPFASSQSANVGAHTHGIPELSSSGSAFNSSTAGSGSITYAATTTANNPSGETRPRNVALLACIKF